MRTLLFPIVAVVGCSTVAPSAPATPFFPDTILLPFLAPAPVGSGFVTA